ncbi:hypothetical protein NC652_022044 [Populus alba x Populus x berolinensis]|nr:hypothetical protein NC652_022044 [Populus alba x Populus x berolinensis]
MARIISKFKRVETFTTDMSKHKGGGNGQNRSTKTLKETKKEDKEEGRDCSQQKGRRGIKR